MYVESGGQHNMPHIHARYYGSEVVSYGDELAFCTTVEIYRNK